MKCIKIFCLIAKSVKLRKRKLSYNFFNFNSHDENNSYKSL